MHKLLEQQLSVATDQKQIVDCTALLSLVEQSYQEFDRERDVFQRAFAQMEAELRTAAERAEQISNRHLQVIFDTVGEGVVIADAQMNILDVNSALLSIFGFERSELVGQPLSILMDEFDAGNHNDYVKRYHETGVPRVIGSRREEVARRKNGDVFPIELAVGDMNVLGMHHFIGIIREISDRKHAEQTIQELAFFDQLTSLPNRTLLADRVGQAMKSSLRRDSYEALLWIDLDNFKTLNDAQGHDTGDMLLRQVAQRLIATVRAEDTVARWGGDEFVVILTNLSSDQVEAASQVESITEKIQMALSQPYRLSQRVYSCTSSIGITFFKGVETSFDDLLKQADLAMYRAKSAGRAAVRFFDADMEAAVVARSAIEADLREGLLHQQFVLYYQAQITQDGKVFGAEVLVRWKHPKRGLVSPLDFIPIAEETGLILPLGEWVLETACLQLAKWQNDPVMAGLTIAVNVSPLQIRRSDFVARVSDTLHRTGANPHRLKLEITESILIDNIQDIIEKMTVLKELGINFSLDDFGTGYSSLSYLKRLPLDQFKIDRSFVLDVLTNPNDAAIAKTIVALAQSLGLNVIAEGVETAEQRDFLEQTGCLSYQGFFFSRPIQIDLFEELVRHPIPLHSRSLIDLGLCEAAV